MDFMNMFEDMMEGLEPSKKETSKKEGKKDKKSKTATPKKNTVKVALPVEVVSVFAEPFILDHVGEEKTETELPILIAHLATQLGFKGLLHEKMKAFYKDNKLYIAEEAAILDNDADVQVAFPVTVAYGPLSAEYNIPEDISTDKEADEITVAMVAAKFKDSFPGFDKAKWYYDPKSSLIIPGWDSSVALKDADMVDIPSTLYFGGETMELTADEVCKNTGSLTPSAKDICEDKLPVNTTGATVSLVKVSDGAYRIVFALTIGERIVSGGGYASGKEKKKVEEKYELPLNLVITGFTQKLTSEDFDGKAKVTKKDVESYLTPKYPSLFKDESRKPSWFYCKELSSLEIVFLSGSKGCV